MVSWPGPAGIFSPGWSEPPTLRRHEVRFGFTIVLDESGVHDHGVSIKRAPSVFDVRLPIDFVCSTSMSRPFLRVLQTAGFDPTRTITPIKSVDWNLENPSKPAYRQNPTGNTHPPSTGNSTAVATKSRTCSENSRTGDASIPPMTAAPTPSSQPSASPLSSSSGSINES